MMSQTSGTFSIEPLQRFGSSKPATIKRPTETACFSYDETHTLHVNSVESLRYYYTPPLGASLSEGFESFQQLDDTTDEHVDGLVKSLEEKERRTGERVQADIVTWRGMLTKIMTAPYAPKFDGFEMNATLFQLNASSFIEESREYKLKSRAKQHETQKAPPGKPSQDLMSYWGYKFEALCLLPDTWAATSREYLDNRTKHVVNNHAQYCSIVETSIGSTKLVLGGEIDAVWDIKPTDPTLKTNWVELKTSAELTSSPASHLNFERKLLKFWAQSFLLGVPKIIVGFRSNDMNGTLLRVQEFETTKIPRMVREQGQGSWDSSVCINFTGSLLEFIKQTITSGGVWKIKRREGSPVVEIWQVEDTGYGDILPPDFVQWREELALLELESAKAAALRMLGSAEPDMNPDNGMSDA